MEATLARCEKREPEINSFVSVLAEESMAAARKADKELLQQSASDLPELFGVPLSVRIWLRQQGFGPPLEALIMQIMFRSWIPFRSADCEKRAQLFLERRRLPSLECLASQRVDLPE